MNNETEETNILSGTILRIPLVVEDEATSQLIKTSSLWLHVSRADYEPSTDPQFTNISLTAIWTEGYFHTTITSRNSNRIFRRNIPNLNLENNGHFELLKNIFPSDLDDLIENKESVGYHRNLKLMAKLIGNKANYDENNEFLEDVDANRNSVTISIKTDAKLAITVGTIEMPSIEFEDYSYLIDEENLFNWMELYNYQNEQLVQMLGDSKREVEKLTNQTESLESYLQSTKKDYEMIVKDLEDKFYQALNAKKDKIYELLYGGTSTKKLVGLNDEFLHKEGQLNVIDKDSISDDEEILNNTKKRTKEAKVVKKKRKTSQQDASSDDEFTKVKEEPQSPELKDDSFINDDDEEDIANSTSEDEDRLKQEPGSPELKDDSLDEVDYRIKIEPISQATKQESFIEDSLAKSKVEDSIKEQEESELKEAEVSKSEVKEPEMSKSIADEETDYSDDKEEEEEVKETPKQVNQGDETDYSDSE
ncbi:hypothetical protein SBY92_003727 [Candida maltosa Xu316]